MMTIALRPLKSGKAFFAAFGLIAALLACTSAHAELSAEDLAKIAQNPVGNLITFPIQENMNVNVGPLDGNQSVLNIQPVIPISISDDWNIITRTIIPIISVPAFAPGQDRISGIGDIQLSAFLSPANPGNWIWGAGVVTQMPSHSNSIFGNDHAGIGPTFVVLHLEKGSPWVYGVLANNIWSVGNSNSPAYSNMLVQPFINYNLASGAYFTTGPAITANWQAAGSQVWTVPMGGGIGKLFKLGGKLPVNTQLAAYYNVVRPEFAGNWLFRVQVQVLLPK
jgi:hypothetical protein